MTFLLAPDSFKHCMTAEQAAAAMARGIRRAFPEAVILEKPMADGGEGTSRILAAALGAEARTVRVRGPLGDPVDATYYLSADGRTAVMEMAAASGIELVPSDRLNPLAATSYGTGELIAAALAAGAKRLLLGIGGSATVDGGAGMAEALGARFLDAGGRQLTAICPAMFSRIAQIDYSGLEARIAPGVLEFATDVNNPLLGPRGAAAVFGPQKGADPEMVPVLEEGLARLADLWHRAARYAGEESGDGAAGGLGAGLRAFLGGLRRPGAELVGELTGFDEALRQADWVLTGEGRTDDQTSDGKLCAYVAGRARAGGVPAVLISGAIGGDAFAAAEGFAYAASISLGPGSLEDAFAKATENLEFATAQFAALLRAARRS